MPILGIDLGTTNSLVSYWNNEKSVIIPNVFGENLTPSVVSVDDSGQIFIGKIAKERLITHPDMTASVFKRNMGSKKLFKLGNKEFLPEELSSLIIRSLKQDAESYLGQSVEEAIISVPAYFNDTQRKATKRAGELAGLKIERLINEPTAAAIAYGLYERESNSKFLVFDLGGGTFDVSILELYKNIMEVRAVAGDNYLGGEDFTNIIMSLFLEHNNLKLEDIEYKTAAYIKGQSEMAKIKFSTAKEVSIKCKIKDKLLDYTLKIDDYERDCQSLISKLRRPIERALSDAKIKASEIDSIVLVGGATKLPIIRTFVSKLFGRIPSVNINPDEAVALGAGIQAAMKERNRHLKEIVLTDVCPYTLGTDISIRKPDGYYEPGHFCPIIERNTVIPVSKSERLYTIQDNQEKINIEILQGESRLSKNNILLGEINIDVPPSPAGEQAVDVRYTYDINGILEVEITVLSNGLKKRAIIEKNPGYMSKDEIEKRFQELSSIKIHPREKEENKLIMAKGERLYEESTGKIRELLDYNLQVFEDILNRQDDHEIEEAAKKLKMIFVQIEQMKEF
ncbi:molecular chaperone HscC [Clostridium tyrobutyricum]|jgi:molecular chaperone HscC|uniref:molecular chaperone HscC n=1 Tax=Clostridium tyrobutyricum TaxID=1519 RepID=UPI001C37EBAA|nr:molecular chaperone HscC [Clostridium tyrobutyricum]MBV4446051.1 molecular chaperone HscC [Clostridium tyrobutyricum]